MTYCDTSMDLVSAEPVRLWGLGDLSIATSQTLSLTNSSSRRF